MKKFVFAAALLSALFVAGPVLAQENWEALHKKSMDAYAAKDYEGAFTHTQQALAQAEKEYGAESQRYAVSAHNLAYMYSLRRNYPEAAKYYQKAIAIRQKMNLQADLALSAGLYGAMLHKELKDPANAEKFLLMALDANRRLYTEKSAQYYGVASELAAMYAGAGKYAQAEPHYLYMKQAMKEQKGATSEEYAYVIRDIMIMYRELGQDNKYYAAMEEMLDIQAHYGLNNTQQYFGGLLVTAQYYEKQKNIPQAVSLYRRMAAETKKAYSDTSRFYLLPLQSLIGLYNQMGDFKNIGNISVDLLDAQKKRLVNAPEELGTYLVILDGASQVFQRTAEYIKAEKSLEEYINLLKKAGQTADTSYLAALSRLGIVQRELGKLGAAEQSFSLAIDANHQKDIRYAADLLNRGYTRVITGRLAEGEKDYVLASKLLKELQLDKTNEYAVALNYLGNLYNSRGKAVEAMQLLNQARGIYAATVGKRSVNYAIATLSLAEIYGYEGDYNRAEELYKEYHSIYEAEYGKEHPEYAFALIRLSAFYQKLGNNRLWEQYLLTALDIQQKTLPENHPSLMTTYNRLGILYDATLQYDKAEKYYLASMDIAKASLGESGDYVRAMMNLAGLYRNQKNLSKATDTYNRASVLARKLNDEMLLADVALGLAYTIESQQDYAKAETYYMQALASYQKHVPENNTRFISLNMDIAGLYRAMRQPAKAAPYYEKLRTAFFRNIDQTFTFLSEAEKQAFLGKTEVRMASLQNFYLDDYARDQSAASRAFANELIIKGLTLNSSVEMRKAIEQSNNAEALRLYDDWMSVRAEIAKRNTVSSQIAETEKLEAQAAELEKQLTRLSAQFNQGRVLTKAGLEDIRAKLGENEVAVEFASFLRNDGVKWQDSVIYVAMVLRRNDPNPQMIRLCHDRQLSELINKKGMDDDGFVSSLYRGTAGTNTQNNQSLSNGKKLYELVWKPIDHLLKEGDKVYFAPSGVLHQIAFAAIPYGDGRLLSDRYRLSQLSSTAMILKGQAGAEVPKSIALFGGIKYDLSPAEKTEAAKRAGTAGAAVTATTGSKGNAWTYLPGTLAEAGAVAKQATAAGYAAQTYFGANGMEESMKKLSGKNAPGIIHIASHGFFFPDPQLNYQAQEKAEENAFSSSANAMNRSGMLFAGANDAWTGKSSATAEDGILTAYEASNLSLGNTGLVVLSACETGLGDIKGNEGVFGLQRAFKMAGVPYLMMSLWKVPDAETAEFMQAFYTGLFGGRGIESSFTAAQDAMKTKYPKEPYKWAAFVLVK